ncbi:MAG: hypothetical protein LBH58_10885 [Tannerellaceae bacterium]|jgi:hypothetical protein|nr:hypothetical protein [Tannerellaceae bacterium]
MEDLNLKNWNVQEIDKIEIMNINGGLHPVVWLLFGLAFGELNDRNAGSDFAAGYAAATGA